MARISWSISHVKQCFEIRHFSDNKKRDKNGGRNRLNVILQRRNFRQVPSVLKYNRKAPMQRYPRLDSRQGARDGIASKKCHTHRSKGSRRRLCGGGGKISDKRFSGFCFLQQKTTEEKQVQLNQKQPKETFWWGHHYLSIRLVEETRLIVFPLLCDTITGAV